MKSLRLLAPVLFLSACGGGPGGSALSVENPGFFTARLDKGVITGKFNPAGFSAEEANGYVAAICVDQTLARFDVTDAGELTSFSAACEGDPRFRWAAMEFERMGEGKVLLEITTSVNGNIQYIKQEL